MDKIVEMPFGSHLYGTSTPDSDKDYKGVFLVSLDDVLLNNVPKCYRSSTGDSHSKNTKDDVDKSMYSLHYFLKLGYAGDTGFIDMIHCPEDMLIFNSDIWQFIRANRAKFYTKSMKSLVSYCVGQSAKYGCKGSRLNDAKMVIDYLSSSKAKYLEDVWESLPEGEHISKIVIDNVSDGTNPNAYQVCGRKLMARAPISLAIDTLTHFHNNYGHRAVLASRNEGIDWKAISHALRAILQLKEILSTGDLVFPLKESELLTKVKRGGFHYINDGIATLIDNELALVEEMSSRSDLPEKVNQRFWNDFILDVYDISL